MGLAVGFCIIALSSIRWLRLQVEQLSETQTTSIARIASKLDALVQLEMGTHDARAKEEILGRINRLHEESLAKWRANMGPSENAVLFREDLARVGKSGLLEEEGISLGDLGTALRQGRSREMRLALWKLLNIHIDMTRVLKIQMDRRSLLVKQQLIALSLALLLIELVLGYRVYLGIAPRLRILVEKVRKFQEYGVNDQIYEQSQDEIAILGAAINSGFRAIENREAERRSFLEIAAHELKTPLSTIQGFSSALVKYKGHPGLEEKALNNIQSQTWRLARIVDALITSMKIQQSPARFAPKPLNLSKLVCEVAQDVENHIRDLTFKIEGPRQLSILGDEYLLRQALTSLFICASALSSPDHPLRIDLKSTAVSVDISVHVNHELLAREDLEKIFAPMNIVQMEGWSGRAATGLYLTREVLRLHGGTFKMGEPAGTEAIFTMEIPA